MVPFLQPSNCMEGPSLKILKEELQPFKGKKVLKVSGNTSQPKEKLKNRTLSEIQTWGKNLFLGFSAPGKKPILTKTHFLMFGSYRINDPKADRQPRLELTFKNGILYLYACSLKFDAEDYWRQLDPQVDLMSRKWNAKHVLKLLKKKSNTALCDLFLDQSIFAGSGNIVKNEVLFNIRRHPLVRLSQINESDWPALIDAVHAYCQNFYKWKKRFELRQHWQVYRQKHCPLCNTELMRENLGHFARRTFYCPKHQKALKRKQRILVYPVLPLKRTPIREPAIEH